MYLFNGYGNVTFGDDVIHVEPGHVKFTIELSDWMWCGTDPVKDDSCKKGSETQVGAYVDFTMTFKGASGAQQISEEDTDLIYSLGGNTELLLLSSVCVLILFYLFIHCNDSI